VCEFSVFAPRGQTPYALINFALIFSHCAPFSDSGGSGADFFAYITLKEAGSMRFRWNETNRARDSFFESLGIASNSREQVLNTARADANHESAKKKRALPLELIHSKKVFCCDEPDELFGAQGDGVITSNESIVPVITVADCVPIFLANYKARCFGALHSGWRGTGIVLEALEDARRVYGARKEDFFIVLGPHIQSCCYTVEKERADFFAQNFSPRCVEKKGGAYHLSLKKANARLLAEYGILSSHIALCADCTSCDARLGSFRRETEAASANGTLGENQFTPMAAFITARYSRSDATRMNAR
jgi:YfiH family protein